MNKQWEPGRDRPATYQVQVQGKIGRHWQAWFNGLSIATSDEGDAPAVTTLTGPVADQAALLGLLQKLYTLGFPLLSVARREDWAAESDSGPACPSIENGGES